MSEREIDADFLRLWLRGSQDLEREEEIVIEALPGDVSPRRYYRVKRGRERAIVAFYPREQRDVGCRFERTTELLAAAGVRVPAVCRVDRGEGLMLLEDAGSETVFDRRHLPWPRLRPWFAAAWEAALSIRALDLGGGDGLLPPLDAAALERELAMTWDVLLVPSGLASADEFGRRLRSFLEGLCADLEAGGLVPCHRDLMARNLVPLEETGSVCLLDHQDLRLGPSAYDAASLFNDSIYPPEREVEEILGSDLHGSPAYDRAVVQRTWKIAGTFASFARRGQERYLPLIPVSLRRGLDHLARLDDALAADARRRFRSVC